MNNTVVLKFALAVVRKRVKENPTGGLKLPSGEKIYNKDLAIELESLVELSEKNLLREIGTCATCECIDFGRDKMGQCYPKGYTSWRKKDDHCIFYRRKKTE